MVFRTTKAPDEWVPLRGGGGGGGGQSPLGRFLAFLILIALMTVGVFWILSHL